MWRVKLSTIKSRFHWIYSVIVATRASPVIRAKKCWMSDKINIGISITILWGCSVYRYTYIGYSATSLKVHSSGGPIISLAALWGNGMGGLQMIGPCIPFLGDVLDLLYRNMQSRYADAVERCSSNYVLLPKLVYTNPTHPPYTYLPFGVLCIL